MNPSPSYFRFRCKMKKIKNPLNTLVCHHRINFLLIKLTWRIQQEICYLFIICIIYYWYERRSSFLYFASVVNIVSDFWNKDLFIHSLNILLHMNFAKHISLYKLQHDLNEYLYLFIINKICIIFKS